MTHKSIFTFILLMSMGWTMAHAQTAQGQPGTQARLNAGTQDSLGPGLDAGTQANLNASLGSGAQDTFGAGTLSLSLAQCRQMAIESSEDLSKSGNALSQAQIDRKIATAAFTPNISGSLTGVYMLPDMDMGSSELRMRGTYMAGISLSQPIYAGGKIFAGRKLSRIGEQSAEEQQRLTRMEVIEEADNAYWTFIAVGSKVKMLQSCLAQMDALYDQVSTSVGVGMATDNDLLKIQAERGNILYQLRKAENGADLCRLALCRVIGADPAMQIEPTDTEIEVTPPGFLSSDTDNRPEIRLLEKQIEAGEQQVRMTRGDMIPSIGLTAGYTYYGNIKLNGTTTLEDGTNMAYTQEFKDGIWVAMAGVSIPIFHWGEARRKVRRAQLDLKNYELDLQKNSRLIDLEVQQAIRNLQDGYMLVTTARSALEQAKENLRVTDNYYSESMTTLTELCDARRQWEEAESNLIEAKTQFKIYETEYLRAIGELE